MNLCCETIISENEKLKLSLFDKIYLNIYDYLNLHHHVKYLKIDIRKKEIYETLFESELDDYDYLENKLEFKQNDRTDIIFYFLSKSKENFEHIKNDINTIKLPLQIFSQSIFNKYMEKSLQELSLVDQVTGSYNRHYLDNYANNILSIANREQKKIAFLKIGVDQFKAVIDEFDYEIGDKVLKALSDSLKKTVRESDIVIKIANDEFLVVLMNIINENNATMISNKLINNFSEEKVIVNEDRNLVLKKTICSGVVIYPDDATNIDEIIKKSDIALYEARNKGRSQTFKFTEEDTNIIDFF
jgi:two-component system, cell cycle response regulator